MGIADRDWYRRQGEDPRPVIALSVRRYAWVRWAAPVAIVAVLLAGVAYQELRITPPVPATTKPAEPGKLQPAPPPAADAVAFPKDGFIFGQSMAWDRLGLSLLTLRMPSDTAHRHWIVSVRDWATGKWWRRCICPRARSPRSLLPTGFYRIAMAAGSNWQGEARLFGTGTQAWEWTSAVRLLSPKFKPVIGSPMEAAERQRHSRQTPSAPDNGGRRQKRAAEEGREGFLRRRCPALHGSLSSKGLVRAHHRRSDERQPVLPSSHSWALL